MTVAYKLFRERRNGTLGSLFIGCKNVVPLGKWLKAENLPTPGFKTRPGWHCCPQPKAPHLSMKGRAWYAVEIKDYVCEQRPQAQGGLWLLAQQMRVLDRV